MFAFRFAHFLVETAPRSFTYFFLPHLVVNRLGRYLKGAAQHFTFSSFQTKRAFLQCVCECGWVWVRDIAQNLCASSSFKSCRFCGLLRFCHSCCRVFSSLHWVRTTCTAAVSSREAQVPVFLLLCSFAWFQWVGSSGESSARDVGAPLSVLQYHHVPTFHFRSPFLADSKTTAHVFYCQCCVFLQTRCKCSSLESSGTKRDFFCRHIARFNYPLGLIFIRVYLMQYPMLRWVSFFSFLPRMSWLLALSLQPVDFLHIITFPPFVQTAVFIF